MLINFLKFKLGHKISQCISLLTEGALSDWEITKHWYDCIIARKTHTEIEYEYTENSGMSEDI